MTVEYLLGDHLGSTSLTTDTTGAKVSEIRYRAWGEIRFPTDKHNPGPSDYTYTGQYSDSYINLLWYGSRHYDPELGRFIQPDSIVPLASQGVQAWDRYAYTNNNPVRFTDPTGHMISQGCGDDGKGSCRADPNTHEESDNIQHLASLVQDVHENKCAAGNQAYCDGDPVEIAAFTLIMWTGGALFESAVLSGGAASVVDAGLAALSRALEDGLVWGLNTVGQYSRGGSLLMYIFDKLALKNPNSTTMVLGQYPNYVNTAEANGYSYYQLPRVLYNVLEKAGWSTTNNANAIVNAVQTGKTILIDAPTRVGIGLHFEMHLLEIFQYPSQWLNGPPP